MRVAGRADRAIVPAATRRLFVAAVIGLTLAGGGNALAASPRAAHPVVVSMSVSPGRTPATGKPVVITVRVRNAKTCTFFSQRVPFSALYPVKTVGCASGHARVTMPAVGNPYHAPASIKYMVMARGTRHTQAQRRASVLQAGVAVVAPSPAPAPPAPAALLVTAAPLPSASAGSPYSATLAATGGTAPYVWSISAGSLPPGLSLSTTGTITGTPTTVGQTSFSVLVTDATPAAAMTATATFSINVVSLSTATATSDNWSGYFETGGPFTSVTGTFNVPSLAASGTTTDTSEWVGIDGVGDQSLIQAGVNELYDPSTNLVNVQAWWEIIPAPATPIFTLGVVPGNTVTVTISELSAGLWAITVTDDTTGQTFTTDQSYSGPAQSAEWIVEAPTLIAAGTVFTLGNYSPAVTFSNLGTIGTPTSLYGVVMVQNGVPVSMPSALVPAGFTVAYGSVVPTPP
jgi:Peptidase A4 family/Putative Ig domain